MFPIRDDIPSSRAPIGNWILIGLNVAVFVLMLALEPREVQEAVVRFGFVPKRYTHWGWGESVGLPAWDLRPWGASLFLHAGWLHLIGNMWTLWIFGDNVEDRMGTWRYLGFYFGCGVLASVVHGASMPSSVVPAVGASGAIAGVLGAYLVLFPLSRVLVLFPILIFPFFFEVPALIYLGVWFALQFMSGTASLTGGQALNGIAWWAHIGGFVAGILIHRRFLYRRPGSLDRRLPRERML